MAFAVSAVAMLGVIALATEVAGWYVARTEAYNAADAAAIAGALAIAAAADPSEAATSVAASNGFSTGGSVTVATEYPSTGTYAGNTSAYEVDISETFSPILANLFTSVIPTVNASAVAMITPVGAACVLSQFGDLNITKAQNGLAGLCIFASNATDATAINISAAVSAYGITTEGDCANCGGATLVRPWASYQPPTTNPYATIDALQLSSNLTVQPVCDLGNCPGGVSSGTFTISSAFMPTYSLVPAQANTKYNGTTYTWATGQPYWAYQNLNLTIAAGATVSLVPGTYIFYNSSLTMSGGTIKCVTTTGATCAAGTGVTIVLTGKPSSSIGNLSIASAASVTLGAPKTSTFNTALNGVLFYRDGTGPYGNIGAPVVNIYGSTKLLTNGAMYFPNAYVWYGNGSAGSLTCTILVGGYISLTNTTSKFTAGNCPTYGTTTPKTQAVRIVQ
jgi:hypothetical protein